MWVMACTLTAVTTNKATPWPKPNNQKAWVRKACRAVNSTPALPPWRAFSAVTGLGLGTPSTVKPMSSGRPRMTDASGKPTTKATSAEAMAVVRQPKLCMDHATKGTAKPPRARPKLSTDKARARWRSNQWMMATVKGK